VANLSVNTQTQAYADRLAEFRAIRSFYGPRLRFYFTLSEEQKAEWRSRDVFLDELLRFAEKVQGAKQDVTT
jgi:hypothetical protein